MKSVAVGDNCVDIYNKIEEKHPGGNALNFAVYMKKLSTYSSYVGIIGDDENGSLIKKRSSEIGIDISHLHTEKGNTAVTYIERKNNDRVFKGYEPGVLNNFTLKKEDIDFISEHDLVHSGIDGQVESYFKIFKEKNLITSFDFSDIISYNSNDDNNIFNILPYVDYAFFSCPTDKNIAKKYIKDFYFQNNNSGVIVFTLGSKGSIAYDGKNIYVEDAIKSKVVDTLGAGDSFIAGFMNSVLKRKTINESLKNGADFASKTINYIGAW